MALMEAVQEVVRLKTCQCKFRDTKSDKAIKMYENNQNAIALVTNPKFYKRSKHIGIYFKHVVYSTSTVLFLFSFSFSFLNAKKRASALACTCKLHFGFQNMINRNKHVCIILKVTRCVGNM